MAIHILPQAQTVAAVAPWLALPNVTIHCPRCTRAFRLLPHDRFEADGTLLCHACTKLDEAWFREMNADAIHGTGAWDRG